MEYLVEGHLGGEYISDCDPYIITQYCEQCGDCDIIVASWEKDNIEAKIEAIADYLISTVIDPPENPISLIMELQFGTIDEIIDDYKERTNYLLNDFNDYDIIDEEIIKPIASIIEKCPSQIIENSKLWGVYPYDEEKLINFLVDGGLKNHYGDIFEYPLSKAIKYVRFPKGAFDSIYEDAIIKAFDEKLPGFSKELEKILN